MGPRVAYRCTSGVGAGCQQWKVGGGEIICLFMVVCSLNKAEGT